MKDGTSGSDTPLQAASIHDKANLSSAPSHLWMLPALDCIFILLCINQTSTILSSESNYNPLSLNLSLWQEETGNIAGKPSNWDQNQSSKKM